MVHIGKWPNVADACKKYQEVYCWIRTGFPRNQKSPEFRDWRTFPRTWHSNVGYILQPLWDSRKHDARIETWIRHWKEDVNMARQNKFTWRICCLLIMELMLLYTSFDRTFAHSARKCWRSTRDIQIFIKMHLTVLFNVCLCQCYLHKDLATNTYRTSIEKQKWW